MPPFLLETKNLEVVLLSWRVIENSLVKLLHNAFFRKRLLQIKNIDLVSLGSFFGPAERNVSETIYKSDHFLSLLLGHFLLELESFEIDLLVTRNDFS